jgi:hypothetical protein
MATSYFSIGFLLPLMMILAYSHAFIPLLNPSLLPRNSELLRRYQSQEISDQSSSSPSEQVRQKLQTQMEILRKQDETSTTIQPSVSRAATIVVSRIDPTLSLTFSLKKI